MPDQTLTADPGVRTPPATTDVPLRPGGPTRPKPPYPRPRPRPPGGARIGWPLGLALACIAFVWVAGCVWSFTEQTAFAGAKGFRVPLLLPVVIDGLAIAMAAVAWAASLDGRAAVYARLGTAAAAASSAASNGAWAWQRSTGDLATVVLAAAVPIAANLAFEVLLSELRRQVMRRRGVPAPVAIPYPRLVRWVLSPLRTPWEWRRLVLDATQPGPDFAAALAARTVRTYGVDCPDVIPPASPEPEPTEAPDATEDPDQPQPQTPARTPSGRTPRARSNRPGADQLAKRRRADAPALRTLRRQYPDGVPTVWDIRKALGCGAARAERLLTLLQEGHDHEQTG